MAPVVHPELQKRRVSYIGCGDSYRAALSQDGAIAWDCAAAGGGITVVVSLAEPASQWSCGGRYIVILGARGELYVSHALDTASSTYPPRPTYAPTPDRFVGLGAGCQFSAVVTSSGQVFVLLHDGLATPHDELGPC